MLPSPPTLQIFPKENWQALAASHFQAARKLTAGARERRSAGLPHPVEDFIFQYYPYPISLLEDWQPAFGIGLEFHDFESLPPRFHARRYRTADSLCYLDATQLEEKERSRLAWIKSLLEATQRNVPHFACHGLHEWAMVYQAENIRHATLAPLRLPQDQIDSLVNSRAITCSHHDAFRFFAKKAQPFNRLQPTLETRHQNEQPGCIHANMDLYKWAAK